ncbi:MAG: hypothetical protein EZS28_037228 [Streblomastix strix]|uniref:Protein kinase domain-containing protein n=1 Tax=Streblomastix strix TaxID=222440 RepID=A0A5J4UCC3_9EUKA|nr:MAG: hypothetical protein EZS28_037228 [Streblomastix strix]
MKNEELKVDIQQQQDQDQQTEQNSQEQKVQDCIDYTSSDDSQSAYVDYEEILRQQGFVPIRRLGGGAFGIVYLAYDRKYGIVALKIIQKEKFDIRELEAAEIIHKFYSLF